jgi:uncharacterized protein YcbK (DUF882 family)
MQRRLGRVLGFENAREHDFFPSGIKTMTKTQKRTLLMLALIGFAATATVTPPSDVRAADARQLSFYHTHTGQSLDVVYYENGEYVGSALDEINRFLKDFRTGDVAEMDPKLLDILHDVRNELGSEETYEVISAYRSPKTNDMLRSKSGGVARNSQHLLGNAIDVRLRGVPTEDLRDTALEMRRGGVGYYKLRRW